MVVGIYLNVNIKTHPSLFRLENQMGELIFISLGHYGFSKIIKVIPLRPIIDLI